MALGNDVHLMLAVLLYTFFSYIIFPAYVLSLRNQIFSGVLDSSERFLQLSFQHKLIHLVLGCYAKQISLLNGLIQSLFAMHFLPFGPLLHPSLNCYFLV